MLTKTCVCVVKAECSRKPENPYFVVQDLKMTSAQLRLTEEF